MGFLLVNSKPPKIEGLGDIIKRLTNAVGVKTCSKCEKRRKKLNSMFPMKKGETPIKEPHPSKPESQEDTG